MFFKKLGKWITTIIAMTGTFMGGAHAKNIDLVNSGYFGFTPLPVSVVSDRYTLLLSDSPEYVGPEGGVLSAGTLKGLGRIYFYHVNDMVEDHKIAIVLENKSGKQNTVTIHRMLKTKPTEDYFAVGRELSKLDLEQPLSSVLGTNPYVTPKEKKKFKRKQETITLQPHSRQLIFKDLEKVHVKKDNLFSGLVDFTSTDEVYARVMMLPMKVKSLGAAYTAKELPIDEVRLRGTYTGMLRTLAVNSVYDSSLGGAYVEVANDREDPFIQGVDEMNHNDAVTDRGNYGVSYDMTLYTKGNEPFRLYFNPLGGAYSGSFTINTTHSKNKNAKVTTETYQVGGGDVPYLGHQTVLDSMQMGSYHGGDTLHIQFMPAGASNLPVRFLLIPEALVVDKFEIPVTHYVPETPTVDNTDVGNVNLADLH
ncbi:hypothetical protein RVY78_08170 [Veillonella sp. YH-vei2232]|uniref:DUF4138 domain-containing protein n=1 Tax=Veillonella absiana TaxID=3079305 RepID=A0ABU3Z9Z4_9FIRM|nr:MULTISPECIES: hypothetical protein [unclassified Veillonella]MDV5063927.1 hypothetical protein [Veillonella sp. YH-vei2232]MDV5088720.1 hypothetical protein [Veillonella sp. YH-vei2233]